jgi:tmRNA-binding protein
LIINSKAVLHPYYKLDYIKLKWGGAKEQEEEHKKGNLDAKDWQDEARKILENTVSIIFLSI